MTDKEYKSEVLKILLEFLKIKNNESLRVPYLNALFALLKEDFDGYSICLDDIDGINNGIDDDWNESDY